MHVVVGTAGHVDHGKSTIVRALTGTDPDRLAQEKLRGLSIELGFAQMVLPSGRSVDFIDVPGHVRFIGNMLAGVGAVQACLFVVAAPEGWKPQSEEHLRILELLGVRTGLVALTKVGLVDSELEEVARLEIGDHLSGTFLADAEIISVDTPTGQGMTELIGALDRMVDQTAVADDVGRPRLWIDRSFVVSGAGTVVTGTLTGGRVAVGDELVVVGGRSGAHRKVRVRAVQAHGRSEPSVGPGRRAALNLVKISPGDVPRGVAVVRPGQWHVTRRYDGSLKVLGSLRHAVSDRGAYKVYLGSGEHAVRLRVIGGREIEPGECGAVRVWLPVGLPLLPGDRFVLRESGRDQTVGGGEVLDVDPVLPLSRAQPTRSVSRVIAQRGWVEVDELVRLTGERLPAVLAGRWIVDPTVLSRARSDVMDRVRSAGSMGLDLASLNERERAVLVTTEGIVAHSDRAYVGEVPVGPAPELISHPWMAALLAAPWSPPDPASFGVPRTTLRELVRQRLVVTCGGVHFAASAIEEAADIVGRLIGSNPAGVSIAMVREALDTTRKYVLPLLAELDDRGVTRREGDLRVAGPRAAAREAIVQ